MINNFGMAAPCEYQLQIIADGKEIEVETKLLTAFGQQVVTIPQKVNEIKIKYTHNIGDTVTLSVYRNNGNIDIQIKLEEMPEEKEETNNSNQNGNSQVPGSIFDLFR